MIDTDGSGHITFEELKAGLKRFGANLKESEIYDLMQAVSITLLLIQYLSWENNYFVLTGNQHMRRNILNMNFEVFQDNNYEPYTVNPRKKKQYCNLPHPFHMI